MMMGKSKKGKTRKNRESKCKGMEKRMKRTEGKGIGTKKRGIRRWELLTEVSEGKRKRIRGKERTG